MIPKAKPGGRPREVDMWEILNAIFYVLVGRSPISTRRFSGLANGIHLAPGAKTKLGCNCMTVCETGQESSRSVSPSEAIVDSQSIKSAAMVSQWLMRAHKGRKRFLTVDSLGLVCEFWSPQRVLENERVAQCSSKSKDG